RREDRAIIFLKISPDSKTILLASRRNHATVRLWDVATEKVTQSFEMYSTDGLKKGFYPERLTAVAFSADSKTVATGSEVRMVTSGPWNGTVRLWDAASGKRTRTRWFKLRSGPKWMRFTNDGNALATDVGRVDLSLPYGLGQASPPPITEVSMSSDKQWVRCDGSDVLWLPHEYRGSDSKAFASHGALIAVGRKDGALSWFSFEPWLGIT
ncbi:hypothetical protein LTR12_005689, partial [Friedmanniomyces endolithicus]